MKIQDGGSSTLKPVESNAASSVTSKTQQSIPEPSVKKAQGSAAEANGGLDAESVRKAVDALNKAVEVSLPNRLLFRLDDGTKAMQVQVIDYETDKVIKEIPPQEILDLMARIKEMVGWFLDERI
ncbi:MAG: flagellar protein FlaG [Firmicutes bacterium]|nr:flagellar protein FlaG [Bacillota bacterium]